MNSEFVVLWMKVRRVSKFIDNTDSFATILLFYAPGSWNTFLPSIGSVAINSIHYFSQWMHVCSALNSFIYNENAMYI